MSVADRLGTGSSFSHAPRGRSARGRAKAVAQGDVPAYELLRLHLDEVSPTPLNPRRNFGTDEEMTRFGEELRQAQLAACVAVTRNAYLALWPEHKDRIGSAQHILVNGERRYRSAVHVGLEALDFVVRDDLASSREQFINHLLKENLDREDFDVIERARGVQQLVDVCAEKADRGARSRAAEQLGRDRSWVTNQLVLLELPEELQRMLSAGSLPERDGRSLARHLKENPGLDTAALLEHLKLEKAALAKSKEQEKAALEAVRAQASATEKSLLSADNTPAEPGTAAAEGNGTTGSLSADNEPKELDGSVSEPASASAADQASSSALLSADNNQKGATAVPKQHRSPAPATKISLEDPQQIARDLALHLTKEQMAEVAQLLLEQVSPR
ncbi:ParB/RepB/Spo0J family partition protein [Streptomyces hygroscopicus]|uniref:ParB family chromosome partitioning protein n=1 Tax=Streptomyces demainii TaxID=588122 RepID=A0ABT9KHQ4_9ACTN|nr:MULTISPECIES: ParB/RepB/Spo0J family partition protein [Streptomyces]MCO8303621.1 ParB/RepB/Spo0J family partition protein [Streptomyces sp. RKCA744]MDP9607760.1 ParB family chromosome partitioning protein [Streptomyces demainii]